jgi:hypothetical protein
MNKLLYIILTAAILVFSCEKEDGHGPISSDGVAPGKVSNVVAEPLPGGVKLTYDVPNDKDLLGVKAVYVNNKGEEVVTNSSVHVNEIVIKEYNDTLEKIVSLYAMDKGQNLSEPVQVKYKPQEALLSKLEKSAVLNAAFGGFRINAHNPGKEFFFFNFYSVDTITGEKTFLEDQFSQEENIELVVIGLDSIPIKVQVEIRDQHLNYTKPESISTTLKPLFESKIEGVSEHKLPGDAVWDSWEALEGHLFDGDYDTFGHTYGNEPFPQVLTIDLGANYQLSRFKMYQRKGFFWTHGNPKKYSIYGKKALSQDDIDNGGNLEDWIHLGDFENKRPSENGGSVDDDNASGNNGTSHSFASTVDTKVRYVRFASTETWENQAYTDFAEIVFYGKKN